LAAVGAEGVDRTVDCSRLGSCGVGSSGTFDGIESSSACSLRTGGCSRWSDLAAGLAATVDRAGSEDAGRSLTIGVSTISPKHRVEVVLAYKVGIAAASTIADDLNVIG